MRRSPLAYPLNRSADGDGGGAADLQTDIMRFMAILSLCLVAIFALVQSIPMTPVEVPPADSPEPRREPEPEVVSQPPPAAKPVDASAPQSELAAVTADTQPARTAQKSVRLTRPKWVPKTEPRIASTVLVREPPTIVEQTSPPPPAPAAVEEQGFTLRFESDTALSRAVAASHVGLYALDSSRAQRMTVSNSRISFWDASMPNTFHEMETATVPNAVIDALERTGTRAELVSWGVTLPGRTKAQLDKLMQSNSGGSLIIGANGDVRLEAS